MEWKGDNYRDIAVWFDGHGKGRPIKSFTNATLGVKTKNGFETANIGDFIVRSKIQNQFFPLNPDEFNATYEKYNDLDSRVSSLEYKNMLN